MLCTGCEKLPAFFLYSFRDALKSNNSLIGQHIQSLFHLSQEAESIIGYIRWKEVRWDVLRLIIPFY